jgi:hypothetical protein
MPMKEGHVRNLKKKNVKNLDRCAKLSIQDFQCFKRWSVYNFGDVRSVERIMNAQNVATIGFPMEVVFVLSTVPCTF